MNSTKNRNLIILSIKHGSFYLISTSKKFKFPSKKTFNVQRKKRNRYCLFEMIQECLIWFKMLHAITLIFMEELSKRVLTKKKVFFPQLFSHRHIKSDMLKSITREFLNFIFTFFLLLLFCASWKKICKRTKKNYSEIRDYCYWDRW